MLQLFIVYSPGGYTVGVAYLHDLCGCIGVIKQGVVVAETFGAEELLMIQRTIWFAKLGMAFGRDVAERVVMHGWDFGRWMGKVSGEICDTGKQMCCIFDKLL